MKDNILKVLLFIVLVVLSVQSAFAGGVEILYTGCTNATLENCRCPNDPYGGMEKRTAEINRRRELGEVLLLDTGDFMPAIVDPVVAPFMIDAMVAANYDVIGLGDQELMQGEDLLRRIINELPVVSANISWANGAPVAEPFVVIEKGGILYAITAIISPDALRFIPPEYLEHISIQDPETALASVLEVVPDNAKRIVLSHSGAELDKENASRWTGVNLIVGGHSQTRIEGVDNNGSIPVVQAGGNARYLGVAKFRGPKVFAELVPILPEYPDDQQILDIVLRLKTAQYKSRNLK